MANDAVTLAPVGSTGNGLFKALGFSRASRIAVEFQVEAVGATPTVTIGLKGLMPGGDPAVASDWVVLGMQQMDSSVADNNTPFALTAVGRTVRFVGGIDSRFFEGIAVDVTANTNVTFSARAYPLQRH
jgi:hypothetical protein